MSNNYLSPLTRLRPNQISGTERRVEWNPGIYDQIGPL